MVCGVVACGFDCWGSIGFVVVVVEQLLGVVEGVGAGLAVVEVGWW